MIKKNKWKLIISSTIILFPIMAGLVLWNALPEQIAIHWGIDGVADGWAPKGFSIFALPTFIFIVHWICVFVSSIDPKNKNQSEKVLGLVLWICPAISLFTNTLIYAVALGIDIPIELIVSTAIGFMIIIIGNYLPKCKQNHTIGIKLPWTLGNEENWSKTHRFSGKMWIIGGIVLMVPVSLSPNFLIIKLFVVLAILVVLPIIHSYTYSKK